MNKLQPLIYLFKTFGCYYIFEANNNRIININKQVYDYLHNEKKRASQKAMIEINKLKNNGFLSGKRVKEIQHPASYTLQSVLESALEKITLQVTQQCNLRCKYCVYSGDAGNYINRQHQHKRMSFKTAKKGIDYLIAHSQNSNKINVGFYGGEPLLEFPLIRDCVYYANEKAEGKRISFSITTNATLLTDEIIDFLYAEDIMLSISLDGPRDIHNKNRVFAGSGIGSFDKIIKNLENIKIKYPDYLQKILFSIVLDPVADYKCISEFFVDYDTIKDSHQIAFLPSDQYSKEAYNIDESFQVDYSYEFFMILLYKMGRLDKKYVGNLNLAHFERLKKYYHDKRKPMSGFHDYGHPGGPCIPGQIRLFMDVDGGFYPCERVSEASEVMRIGSVDEGIDVEKCMKILNVGRITESSCKSCWAFNYCTQCAAFADDTKSLSPKKRLSYCESIKQSVSNYFKDYCTLLELGYDFDDECPMIIQKVIKEDV